MEKKQTAIQMMIEYLNEWEKDDDDILRLESTCARVIKMKATELLSVEKSNIVEAYKRGSSFYQDSPEDYYNQTFSSLT